MIEKIGGPIAAAYQSSSEQQYQARGGSFYDGLEVTDDWNKAIFQHDNRASSRKVIELDSSEEGRDEEDE